MLRTAAEAGLLVTQPRCIQVRHCTMTPRPEAYNQDTSFGVG